MKRPEIGPISVFFVFLFTACLFWQRCLAFLFYFADLATLDGEGLSDWHWRTAVTGQ